MHRLYENGDITVFWDSDRCRHEKKCVQGSPMTFDPMRRPWIDMGKADTAEIWQAVENCPSGALTCVYNHGVEIRYNKDGSCSEAYEGSRKIGECDHKILPENWVIYHTEVLPEYEGKGIGKRLVYKVIEEAERAKQPVLATCSYAKKVLEQ